LPNPLELKNFAPLKKFLRGPDLADANCPVMSLQINRFPNVFARGQNL